MDSAIIKVEKVIFSLLILLSVFFINNSEIHAHSSLKDTLPEGNAVLKKGPQKIEVWFQDPVVVHGDSIKLTDLDGKQVSIIKSSVDPNNAGHVITQLEKELGSGQYKVQINVIAQDGDVIKENFRFTVEEIEVSEVEEFKLVQSNVSDGEIYKGSPEQIELWFNHPAEVTAIGIFDDQYQPVQTGQRIVDPEDPRHIIIPLSEKLSAGTFQITWYATSVNKLDEVQRDRVGVFYFAVEEFSSMTPVGGYQNSIELGSFNFSFGLKQLSYWFTFFSLTILFGMACFDSVILKSQVKQIKRLQRTFILSLIGLIGLVLLIIHYRLEFSKLPLIEFISLKFTWMPIIQIVLIILALWMKKLRIVLYGIALIMWPFLIGHASYPRYGGYLTMVVTVVHILAVGIWIGGLAGLIVKPKHVDSEDWFKSIGVSFSKWALMSIILIVISGVYMTVEFLPSFSLKSLIESEWGISLVVKVALFLLVLILGYLQRKAIKKLSSNLVITIFKRARTEVVYTVLIFFFAASLVAANPSAAEQGIYEDTIDDKLGLQVDIEPLEMGLNTIKLDFDNYQEIEEIRVELSMPPNWKIENKAFKVEEGVYKLTGNLLHAAGTINMKVKVKTAVGEEIQLPYRIVVPGENRFNE